MRIPAASVALTVAALLVSSGCAGSAAEDRREPGDPVTTADAASSPTAPTPTVGAPTPPDDIEGLGIESYVAMGDSFTAAPGVPVTETETGCMRSDHNYPSLVGRTLGVEDYRDVSCGGASTSSLTSVQHTSGGPQPPQLDALDDDTDLVTLGIGGNDEGLYSLLVFTCTQVSTPDSSGAPCRDEMASPRGDQLIAKLPAIQGNVTTALREIRERAPSAEVLVVGYPQLVPASDTCPELPLAPGDYPYARSVLTSLNQALEAAADDAGATYVDLEAASEGHDICAGDQAWVNGVTTDLDRAILYHPFPEGQVAAAQLVLDAL